MSGETRDWVYYSAWLNSLTSRQRLVKDDEREILGIEKEYEELLALPNEGGNIDIKIYAALEMGAMIKVSNPQKANEVYDKALGFAGDKARIRILVEKFEVENEEERRTAMETVNLIVEKDQDSPEGLPFYETRKEDCDLMVGEFMVSSIFIHLPKNTKEDYPDLHAVGRSIILWYYALEKRTCRPILMHNLKISVERDDEIMVGFTIIAGNYSLTLTVGQNLLGEKSGHDLEQSLLTAVLHDADKKGYVLFREYKALLRKKLVKAKRFWKINAIRPEIKAKREERGNSIWVK